MSDPNYAHRFLQNRIGLCKLIVSGSYCGLSEDAAVHRRHADIEHDGLDRERQKSTRPCCQQAQAEVLASVKEAFRYKGASGLWGHIAGAKGERTADFVIQAFEEELISVQPAASALEALLREEREKYTKLLDEYGDHAGICDVSNTVCTCGWEKARAERKG